MDGLYIPTVTPQEKGSVIVKYIDEKGNIIADEEKEKDNVRVNDPKMCLMTMVLRYIQLNI